MGSQFKCLHSHNRVQCDNLITWNVTWEQSQPPGAVIVIISGQNTFSVLIACYRLCSSLLGTVSSYSNVVLFHIGAIFTRSRCHRFIFPLWSPPSSALSRSSVLGRRQPLDFAVTTRDLTHFQNPSAVLFIFINLRLSHLFVAPTRTL